MKRFFLCGILLSGILISCGEYREESAPSSKDVDIGSIVFLNVDIVTMKGDSVTYVKALVVKNRRIFLRDRKMPLRGWPARAR